MNINIEKAKQVSIMLLQKDIKIYNNLIPLIEKMDNDSFENLFLGNKDYDYKIKSFQFKLLLSKFNNYRLILYQWYESEDKYGYLEQLWLKNVSLESLSDKDNSQIENFLGKLKINFKYWSNDSKNDLFMVIAQSNDTDYKKVENFFKNMPKDIGIVLSYGKGCSDELMKKNAKEGAEKVGERGDEEGVKEIGDKILDVGVFVVQNILNVGKHFLPIIKTFIKKYINIPFKEATSYIANNINHFKSNLISQLNNKKFQALTVISSLVNLGLSIRDYIQVTNLMEKIKKEEFSKRIKKIKTNFYSHKKNFIEELKNADIINYEIIISKYNFFFKSYFKELNDIITAIQKYIETVNYNKGKSIGKVVFGILEFGFCLTAAILTDGIALPLLYGSCAIINEVATMLNGVDIALLKDLEKELKEYLEEAENTKKIFLYEVKQINEMLNENEKAKPLYWSNENEFSDIK